MTNPIDKLTVALQSFSDQLDSIISKYPSYNHLKNSLSSTDLAKFDASVAYSINVLAVLVERLETKKHVDSALSKDIDRALMYIEKVKRFDTTQPAP